MTVYNQLQTRLQAEPHTWLVTGVADFIRIRKALQDYPEIDFEVKEFAGGVMVTFAQKQPESHREGVRGGVSPESAHLNIRPE